MSYSIFKDLHKQDSPLILGNVWDAQSTQLAEKAGFKALGSSSHAIANILGYADGENISVEEILFMVERIVKATKLPVSVDFEAGYSQKPEEVAQNVAKLSKLGVVGINLEDGKVVDGNRKLEDSQLHADKIKAIKNTTKDIFINARIDTYTTKHDNALEESIKRIAIYEAAGADGIFIPLAQKPEDLKKLVASTKLPINLFLTPDLPPINKLAEIGIKRISHGAKIFEWLVKQNLAQFESFIKKPQLP